MNTLPAKQLELAREELGTFSACGLGYVAVVQLNYFFSFSVSRNVISS